MARVSFGLKTMPAQTSYEDLLAVWREADGIESIEDAWLWDHLLQLAGPKEVRSSRAGPCWPPWRPRRSGCGWGCS